MTVHMRVRKSVSFVRIFPHTYTLIHKDIKDLEGWIEATAPPSLIYYARRDEELRTTYEKKNQNVPSLKNSHF